MTRRSMLALGTRALAVVVLARTGRSAASGVYAGPADSRGARHSPLFPRPVHRREKDAGRNPRRPGTDAPHRARFIADTSGQMSRFGARTRSVTAETAALNSSEVSGRSVADGVLASPGNHGRYSTYRRSVNTRVAEFPLPCPLERPNGRGRRSEPRSAQLEEPALRRSIISFGMVKGVAVYGDTAAAAVAPPLAGDERAQVVHGLYLAGAVLEATDAARVELDLREMTDEEKQAVARLLKGEAPRTRWPWSTSTPPTGPRRAPTRSPTPGRAGPGDRGSWARAEWESSVTTACRSPSCAVGNRVAAVDADVWGFSMPRMLGIQEPPDSTT